MDIEQLLSEDEGRTGKMYKDSKGIWTVGVGHNMEDGELSEAVISMIFQEDLRDTRRDAMKFSWFEELNEPRQAVILNMIFNMGLPRFSGFKNTIDLIRQGLYQSAADEMLRGSAPDGKSKWYHDVKAHRAERLAEMMRSGSWPE